MSNGYARVVGFTASMLPDVLKGALQAPYTFSDFTDSRIWKAHQPDKDTFTLTPATTGFTIQGKNPGYAQLVAFLAGVHSKGKFFPDIATNLLDITFNIDQYINAGVIGNTRFFRAFCAVYGMYNYINNGMLGVSYGMNEGGNERAMFCSYVPYGLSTSLSSRVAMGDNAPIAANSLIKMRLKFLPASIGGRQAYVCTYSECDLNTGAINYTPAMAPNVAYEVQNCIDGLTVFAGSYACVGSALFKMRLTSIVLNSGFYIP